MKNVGSSCQGPTFIILSQNGQGIARGVVLVGKWDDSLISRVQQANEIVDVVSEYLSLDKRGKEYVGLCPFHSDHRPSMYVTPVKQIFKCFACGAGGDVIKFVQMKENLSFAQAIERLAGRAGIALPTYRPERRGGDETCQNTLSAAELAKINAWAMKHWAGNLWDPSKGAAARQYLAQRNITEQTARTWGLGLALDKWDDLIAIAQQNNISQDTLVAAGLAVRRDNTPGCYDKFRNRLMFPIADVTGRVAGFGGRTLGQDPAKYMNSPATALFDKSQLLYGLRQGRQDIVKAGRAVVVEGYTDVLMAHQHGLPTVIAALGTSLTAEHAKVLRRYGDRIVLVFDSDVAGRAAAGRAMEVCLTGKVDVRLAFVPDGKDPCDYLVEAGREAFEAVIDAAEDVLSFKWNQLAEQLDGQDSLPKRTEAVQQFLRTVAATIQAGQVDSLALAVLIGRLSALLKTPKSRIDDQLRQLLKHKPASLRTTDEPQDSGERQHARDDAARREILEVLLQEPELYASVFGQISVDDFGDRGPLREIAAAALPCLDAGDEVEPARLLRQIETTDAASLLSEMTAATAPKGTGRRRLEDSLAVLEQLRRRARIDAHKEHLTDEATDVLQSIHEHLKQQKGNLRCGGLQ